ncbi:MAG: hypothetical protein ACHQ4H_04075 [Ktedonobacterales bacterium]
MQPDVTTQPPTAPDPLAARRPPKRQSRIWRRTGMRRAIVEGLAIYCAGRLLGTITPGALPDALYPLIVLPLLRLSLTFLPPIWAAMRVVSTKREKLSARFWRLGPQLALLCGIADVVIALALGDTTLLGGPVPGGPDIARFSAHGVSALAPGAFAAGELKTFGILLVYYTMAVVCVRLANGGFMRFTMPAGNGRVTL